MKQIKVGFSRPTGWFCPFSWIIRLFLWTSYSHVYIRFYTDTYERWLVYQASSLFVNFYGPDTFSEKEYVIREFDLEISDEALKKVVQFAVDHAGSPYDLISVFGLGIVKIARLFGKKIKNPFGNRKGFFCSELVGEILVEIMGDDLPEDFNVMSPKDIYEHLDIFEKNKK